MTDERGWVLTFGATFRNPFGQLNYTSDNWRFTISPFAANLLSPVPNNIIVYSNIYNPFTPLGPLYGVVLSPSYPIPYSRLLRITLNLPAGAPIAATTVYNAGVGKIWIQDEKLFLRSVKKHTLEQMTGRKIERYP